MIDKGKGIGRNIDTDDVIWWEGCRRFYDLGLRSPPGLDDALISNIVEAGMAGVFPAPTPSACICSAL